MIVVVMGVTGCGKSSVGQALAQRLDGMFIDADDYHPPANRVKLARNIPLTDQDRWPWLRLLADLLRCESARNSTVVLACSALKQTYRDVLCTCASPVVFVHVTGTRERIAERLCARAGQHELVRDFDRILEGQFRDLEPPMDAIVVENEKPLEAIIEEVFALLRYDKSVSESTGKP